MKFIKNMVRSVMNEAMDEALSRLIKDQYTENMAAMVPVGRKVGFPNFMEILMRSAQGTPVPRPLGSYIHFSPWESLLFNPVHLFRMPTPEQLGIGTSVTIGPLARKPLTISIPIMIAAMSFGGALSKSAKLALAKAATAVGTATNSGEAGLMKEEREAARLFIGQYNRGGWMNTPDKYKQLDAIEIQLGQGAQGSTSQRTSVKNIGEEYREVFELKEGEPAIIHSRLPGVNTTDDFIQLVRRLRDETGVPVGLKIAATHHLEKELEVALEAGVDFLTLDGAEGGTHGGAPTLQDDVGLPTLFAITRASQFLARKRATGKVSLIATGGLVTPGSMLKAMALGADAVYIGTAAILALIGEQVVKSAPFEAATSLVVYTGKRTSELDVDMAALSLQRYLNASVTEMELVAQSLGRTSLSELSKSDLCTMDADIARTTGIQWGWAGPEERIQAGAESALFMPHPSQISEPESAERYTTN
ncbi:FMN-binding glutamate synthase family protein [Paenibacillus oenotherae]|uniref:FMN-binding glutamate synthase family protein n=1 Tax=Paenibacillus oenotherae TaxID=1435645 RepID=A0ABS7DAU3_9BACL|nr:FMN-binding glutamate synthase family protein [Paenibacillus oenotherae]MBW7477065.1 FMN-binding glutamate synthase family protein [Paenibacillus oenotherae]